MQEEIKTSCGINHRWDVRADYPDDKDDPNFIAWDYPIHLYLHCRECDKRIDIETFSEF